MRSGYNHAINIPISIRIPVKVVKVFVAAKVKEEKLRIFAFWRSLRSSLTLIVGVLLIIGLLPALSAFEAHIINVTATIVNDIPVMTHGGNFCNVPGAEVEISVTLAGASIVYTTDGTDPVCPVPGPQNSTIYTVPFTLTSSALVKARSCHDGKQSAIIYQQFNVGSQYCPQTCPTCDGTTITVDQNVTINFNTNPPTYTGDPDLLPYFSYDNSSSTAAGWKAIFVLGGKKLLIKNGATITTTQVPTTGTNRFAPGIEITTTCSIEIEPLGAVVVESSNRQAGDIHIHADGPITINGLVRNEVTGTNGFPGRIIIDTTCGDYTQGTTGLVEVLGIDPGGNDINIFTENSGNIIISGLVLSRAHAHVAPLTQHRPNINVVAFNGSVTINASSTEPLYDEINLGALYDLWGGLLSWVTDNVNPGKVQVQAKNDIIVNGHGNDPTAPVRDTFGAIAAIATASDAPGGVVDVRSLERNIFGNNRAFDVSGRNRLATNFAHIYLLAEGNINTSRPGANTSFNPVVDASSPSVGDKGGTNEMRAYSGGITNNTNALISALVPAGSGTVQGVNLLTSCLGVTNNGSITPADLNVGDDIGTCSPAAPTPIFTNISQLDDPIIAGISLPSLQTITSENIVENSDSNLSIDPAAGAFCNDKSIEISLSTTLPDAQIIYTLDGTEPVCSTNGYVYDRTFFLSASATVKASTCLLEGQGAIATWNFDLSANNCNNSAIATLSLPEEQATPSEEIIGGESVVAPAENQDGPGDSGQITESAPQEQSLDEPVIEAPPAVEPAPAEPATEPTPAPEVTPPSPETPASDSSIPAAN